MERRKDAEDKYSEEFEKWLKEFNEEERRSSIRALCFLAVTGFFLAVVYIAQALQAEIPMQIALAGLQTIVFALMATFVFALFVLLSAYGDTPTLKIPTFWKAVDWLGATGTLIVFAGFIAGLVWLGWSDDNKASVLTIKNCGWFWFFHQ